MSKIGGFGYFVIVLALIFLIVIVAGITYKVFSIVKRSRSKRAIQQTVTATIIKKKMVLVHSAQHKEIDFIMVKTRNEKTRKYITFQLENGSQLTLRVPNNTYEMFFEGEQGSLTYKGNQIIEFRKN